MDVLGKLRELVAIIFQKDNQDIRIQPNASTTYTATTTVNLPDNDAATQELTGNAATQTLTNKTIVAANNTVTTAASGNIASTELDAAIAEGDTNLTNHLNDATDAHAGSAITNTPSGNLAATDMQGAVDELQTELDSATTHTSDTANPHSVTASQVGLGNVTNVATDDTAYNATSWDANNDAATKNAIRDKVETMDTAIGLNTAKVSADGSVTSHSDVTDAGSGAIITGAERTKLDGIESGATADQSDAEIKTAYENNADTNAFTDAEQTKLTGIESGATADQSDAEIKTAYENNANTNAFTDADESKLDGIEASADVTDTANVEAALPHTTTGDILYSTSGTTLGRLAIGSDTEVLTLAGGVPTWAASAGGAGGLEIEVKDANFTAVDGKHYLCTENVTAVTLPAMTATAKIAFSPIRSADWGNTTMTLTPDGAETTEGDATFDADASSVDVMTFTADIANTNWEVLTTISPSAATAGGDVTGPGSSTDNAVARFDSTTGKLLQDSKFAVADNGDATLDNDSAQAQFSLDGQTTNGGKLNFKYGGTTSAYISSNNGGSNTGIYFGNQGSFDRFVISHGGSIHPAADNIYSCGTGSFRWTAVYATNGSINTSDERQKDNIEDLSLGLNFVNSLSPVSYTWKANPDYGTSWGFIAQDVAEKVPQDSSIATYDAEDDVWGLNYAQFTAVNTKAIQELSKMVEDLKKEMAELVKTNTHKE